MTDLSGTQTEAKRSPSTRSLWLTCGLITLVLLLTSVLQYLNGLAQIDLAIFDQGLWAASRGYDPYSSLLGETLLEDHFSLGLFLFVPLYYLAASPIWLLATQAIAALVVMVGIGNRLKDLAAWHAVLIPASLLVFPSVGYALLFDFHAVVIATPFALAAMWALEDAKPWRAALLGGAAAAFRLEVGAAVLVAFLALPGRFRPRLVPLVALAIYVVVGFVFDARLGETSYWDVHYSHLGSSPFDAVTNPIAVAQAIFSAEAFGKALPWLLSSAGLALLRPRLLLPGLAVALPALLSQWPGTSDWGFHYGFAPVLLFSLAWIPVVRDRPRLGTLIIVVNVCIGLVFGPLLTLRSNEDGIRAESRVVAAFERSPARCMLQGIPEDAVVSAAQRPAVLLAHRRRLYLWPYPFKGVPQDLLPLAARAQGNHELAEEVDYAIALVADQVELPGFILEGRNEVYERYVRAGLPRASLDC